MSGFVLTNSSMIPWVSWRSPATSSTLRVTAAAGFSGTGASACVGAPPGGVGAPQAARNRRVETPLAVMAVRQRVLIWSIPSSSDLRCAVIRCGHNAGGGAHDELCGEFAVQRGGVGFAVEQLQEQGDRGPSGLVGGGGHGGQRGM